MAIKFDWGKIRKNATEKDQAAETAGVSFSEIKQYQGKIYQPKTPVQSTATTRTPTGMSRGSQSSTDNNGNYVNQKRVYGGNYTSPERARSNYAARSGVRQSSSSSTLALDYLRQNGMSTDLAGMSAQQVRDKIASTKDDDQREQMRTYAQWLEDQGDKATISSANDSIGAGTQKTAKAAPVQNWSNPTQAMKVQNLQHQQTVLGSESKTLNQKGDSIREMETRLKKISDAYNAHPTKLLSDRYDALYKSYQQTVKDAQAGQKSYQSTLTGYKKDSRDYAQEYDDATRYGGMDYDAVSEYAAKLKNQASRTQDEKQKQQILQERDRALTYRNTLGTPEQLTNTENALKMQRTQLISSTHNLDSAANRGDTDHKNPQNAASQQELDLINSELRTVQQGREQSQNKENSQKFINYAAGDKTEKLPDVKASKSYINYLINGKKAIKPSPELQAEANKIEKSIALLPENERKAMQYYINQGDVENAAKFYTTIKDEAERLYSTSEAESAYKWAGKSFPNAVAATVGSGIIGAVGTQSGWLDNLISAAKNSIVDSFGVGNYRFSDTNGDAYLGSRVSGAMQEGVQTYNNRTLGEGSAAAGTANTLAGATTSAIENVVQFALFGEYMLPVMALGAAGQSSYETLRSGGSEEDAAVTSAVDGAVEYLTEVIPFQKLLDRLDLIGKGGGTMSVADIAKMVRSQGLEEANEEVVGNIAENLFDMAYHKDQSDFWKYVSQLKDQGYSEDAAEKEAYGKYFIGDSLEAGISAYISSAMMFGGSFVNAKVQTDKDTRILGQTVKGMAGSNGISLDNELRKGLLLNDDTAATLSKEHANGGDISTKDAAVLAQKNSDALLELIQKAQDSGSEEAKGAVLRLMANTRTGNMLGVQSEDVAYLQQVLSMSPETSTSTDTNSEKKTTTVLDRATTAFTDLGMKLSVAQKKADVVNRLVSGADVTDSEINSLNPTNSKFRQLFTDLTGVQFPERASIETYRNLYRSASSVDAQVAQTTDTMNTPAVDSAAANDAITQILSGNVPAAEVSSTVQSVLDGTYTQKKADAEQQYVQQRSQSPEVQEQAAKVYATVNGDLDENGNRLATFKEFSNQYRLSVNPTATNTETAVQYQNYLEDNRTTRFNGQRMNYRSFSNLLRTAPGGNALTDTEIRTLFDGAGKGDTDLADSIRSTAKKAAVQERAAKLGAVVTRMKSLLSGTGVKDIVIDTEGWAAPENNESARHNGYIENGIVHLNGNLITTESAVYYTLGHELTHAAYDAKGKAILDNIISAFQELQKKGALTGTLSTRVQNLEDTISRTRELYEANDTSRTYTEDDIRQEVAADLMSEVFGSKELMDRLAGVKPSILDRARDIVTQMLSKITGDTSGETVQILKHLSDNFADALKGFDTYHTGETVVDEKGEPVGVSDENGDTKLSLSTYEQSGRDLIRKWVAVEVEDNQLTQQDADDITDSLESIYETCRNYKNEFASFSAWSDAKVISDENGKPAFSVVKANGEYAMNLDFSTVCKKRRTLDAVLNKLVESGLADSFEFGQEDIVDINNIIKQNGFEIACALCFVDAKRFRWAGDVDTFVTPYNDLVRSLIPEGKNYKIDIFNFGGDTTVSKETGKTLDTIPDSELDFTKIDQAIKDNNDKTRIGKIARLLRDDPKQRCLLLRGDLLSSGGAGAMVKNNPVLFETFNGSKGAGAAKASFADVQYQNEMIGQNEKSFDSEKAYSVGGVRIQSFSDYIPNMVFDYVQMLGDMSAKKLPAHAYTKEFLFAAQFGLTGIKINLSLIPKVDTEHTDAPAGLDADGNYLWADESFDFDLAVKIQNAEGYSKNCGSIAVGVSYEHIMKMMEDPNIRMIIPYHKSGINPIVAEMNNIDRFEDFTNYQSTRYADSGKKLNKTDIKNDFLYNDYLHKNGDPRATAEQYVRWCEDKNYIPKFDQMKLRDGRVVSLAYLYKDGVAVEKNGKKVVNPNYYKVLEDFSVYDAVTDEYTPQGAVQMKFPDAKSAFGSMKNLIRQGLQENQDLEERRSEKVDGMVEQIKEVLRPVKRQSITAQQDEEYQKAADSGDMETAQKLADDAAKQSGFGVVAYHGTPTYGFNSFDPDRIGKNSGVGRGAFYFTSNQGQAESYATPSKTATASNMLANMNKVFQQYNSPEIRKITGADDDAEGIEWDLDAISDYVHDRDYIDFNYDPDEYDSNSQYRKAEREAEDAGFKKYLTEQAEDLAKQSESIPSLKGFADDIRKAVEVPEAKSGVYKVYLYDAGKTKTYTADENTYNDVAWKAASESKDLAEIHLNNGDTVYFTSNPANIKSADAVVRDDAGNVIPLSQRFNRTKNDIRYSITKSSDGKELTQEQQDYFKDSRVRDSSGNLLKVYHGTQENFTVFDRDKIGSHGRFEGAGFNFTPSQDRASSYSNGQNVLEGYLNITHPLSSETKTILVSKLAALIRDADPTGDNIISNYAQNTADYGKQSFINRESLTTARQIWNNSDNDVDIYSELSSGDPDASALISQFEKLGYDGVIHYNDDGSIKTAVAFSSEQFKNANNQNPTANKDIRYSLTDNTLPSDEDIKNGSATFLGMQIKYEPNMHAEADSWGSYMRVSDKFFSLDDSTKRQILNHEVAHNVADDIMARDWDGAAKDGLFITHKIAPEGSKRAGQDYWEGMYGDINNSLSETLATAAATYFTNPDSLKARSQAAYDYIDNFVRSTGSQMGPRYSLTEVSPVQPSENAEWSRGLTEQQISDLGYKLFGDVSQEEIDAMTPEEKEIYRKGHETQVKSTVSSYEKIFDGLKRQSPDNWQNLRVLDASSGLGYGTQAGRNAGFNVTDIEPYPSTAAYAEGKPDYTDYTKLAEQVKSGEVKPFDVIISNAVLNVLPQDTVDNLVSAMGELLAPGGTMYINVRDRSFLKDVLASPKNRLLNYNGDIQTTTTTGGKTQAVLPTGLPAYDAYVAQTKTVQRGYTYNELASYLKDALGDGYTVSRASFLGSAAAVVQKGQVAQQTATDSGKRFSITPEFEQWYKDHYDTESVTDSQLERRLQHQDEKIQNQKESEQAKLSMQNKAWEMYDQRTKRQQAQAAAESKRAALDQAQKEKVQALSDLKEYLDAKAAVQYDADRMHEGRVKGQAIARLTQHEKDRVDQLKAHEQERVRLADRRARAVLQDQNRVNTIRQREAVVNGPVDTIRNSPERMAQVNFVQKEADRLRTLGRSAYATFWNNAQAIDDFAKKQDDGMAGILVNIVRGVNSTVDQIYTKGLVDRAGNQIGSSMKDTFLCMDGKNVDENKQALLQDYMLHQHNIDRMGLVQKALDRVTQFESEHPEVAALDSKGLRLTIVEDTTNAVQAKKDFQAKAIQYARLLRTAAEVQNKPIFADKNGVAVTADTSRQIVAQYVKDNPWLAEKSKGIHEWWSQFMQTWAVGDSVTEDMYDMLERVYPNYAPTYRVQGKGVGTANFVGANGATPGQAIKKAKGGLSEVVNIEDSYANLVQKTIKLARVNELYKSIVDSAMRDADGKFSTMAVYDWENSGVSKQEVFGEDADEIEDNAIQSGLAQDRNGYTVSAWFNGKLERAYISKDLFNSLKATTTSEANGFTKLGAKITGPMKQAITGINPNFALRNVSRDMPTAIINSISGLAFPKYWAQAAKEIATNSENWQHFQTLGGAQANYYNNENGFAKALSKNDNVKSKTLKAVGWFNEVTESQTRFAEYLATIDRLGGDTYENRLKGIKNAAEVTVDFGRHGTVGKAINAWVPYWNPSMQGIDKVIRSVVQTKDGRVLFSKALSTLGRAAVTNILPEILMYAILKKDPDKYAEWAQLSDRTKDTYYCIPCGDHKFLKIPKNREWGSILGTPLMRILEGENGRADPFANYVEDALIPNFLPNQIIGLEDGRVTSDIIGLSQGLELNSNKDFAGRTIVPYAYQQGSLSQQYDADTSWYAKKLGDALDLSPMQIDYVMKSYFGDFADMAQKATSDATWGGDEPAVKEISNGVLSVITKPWVADSRYSNQNVSDYYEMIDNLGRVVQDKRNQMGTDAAQKTTEYKTEKALEKLYGSQITDLNKQARNMPDGEEKDAIKQQIVDLSQNALKYYDDCMSGDIKEPLLDATYSELSSDVSSELIRMDSYSEEYKFKPTGTPSAKYTDPDNKKREYVLDDDEKTQFKSIYNDQYSEAMTRLISTSRYRNAKDEKKAQMLEDLRDDVLDDTKTEFFKWLRKQGIRSTEKK